MKRMMIALIGFVVMFLGVGLVLPALAKVRDLGAMPSDRLVPYTVGITMAIIGLGTTVFSLIKRRPS